MYIIYPLIGSLTLGFLFMNIPPVNKQFMTLFGVGYDGLSLFLSGLLWSHALSQVPAGLVVDRLGVWRSLLISMSAGIICNILPFLAPENLTLAITLRFIGGLCTGLGFLAIVKVLMVLTPPEKLTTVQGIQGAGFCFGTIIPYLLLPLFGSYGWYFSYILGALFLALTLGLTFSLPADKIKNENRGAPKSVKTVMADVKIILSSKPIWVLGIFHGFSYGSLTNLGQWLPSILTDLDTQGRTALWAMATMGVLLVGTLGRAFGRKLSFGQTRVQQTVLAIVLIGFLYLALAASHNAWLGAGVGLLMALVCGSTYGAIFTLTGEAVSASYVATAIGLMNMIANLFNVVLTIVFGYVREHTGSFSSGLLAAGLFVLVVWALGRHILKGLKATR